MSSTRNSSNTSRTQKTRAIFGLGEGITEGDGTIKFYLSHGLYFYGSMRVLSSSEDSGRETEACNTNVWNNKPGNFSTIVTLKCWKTGTKAFIPSLPTFYLRQS